MKDRKGVRSHRRWVLLLLFAALAAGLALVLPRIFASLDASGTAATGSAPTASATAAPTARPAPPDSEPRPRTYDEDTPQGTLRLEGQVIDDEEAPVSGAVISLSSIPPREAESSESGLFKFDGLPPGRYSLAARSQHGFAGPVTVELHERTEPVTLRVKDSAPLTLRVVRASDRAPIAGASCELRGPLTVSGQTDSEGNASLVALPPGAYTAVAWADGYAKTFQGVFLPVDRGAMTVEMAVTEAAMAAGRVVDSDGRAVAGATVGFERASSSGAPGGPDPSRDGAVSGPDGKFKIASISQGTYRFTARHPDHAPGSSSLVTVVQHRPAEDILIRLPRGGSVSGQVVGSDGAGVAGATVRIAPTAGRPAIEIRQTVTGDRGEFRVSGLPRVEVELVALSSKGSSDSVLADLSGRSDQTGLVLTLTEGGTISGMVVDAEGEGVAEAQVTAVPDATRGNTGMSVLRGLGRDVTDAGGRFTIRGLRGDWYSLRASPPGSLRSQDWAAHKGVSAKVGTSNVRLVLQASGRISGKVQLADGSVPQSYIVSLSAGQGSVFSASDGAFSLDEVPAGETSIVVGGPSITSRAVHGVVVDPGKTTDVGVIVVNRGRTISGRVLDQSGQGIAGATVFAGGRVIGDGEHLTMQSWGSSNAAPKTVQSDEAGNFTLSGLAGQSVALIADHPTAGRSATVVVPASQTSSSVDLLLIPPGTIDGLVTRGGEPVANIAVNASPRSIANSTNFVVKTGADGHFRFERVAPDRYLVSAMTGVAPVGGISMQGGVTVEVTQGATVQVTLELSPTTTTLIVTPTLAEGSVVTVAEIHVFSGVVSAAMASQVHDRAAAVGDGFYAFSILIAGAPARIKGVPQGPHTVCVVPYPSALMSKNKAQIDEYVDLYGSSMPAVCVPVTVAGEPEEKVNVPVVEPPFQESKPGSSATANQGTAPPAPQEKAP